MVPPWQAAINIITDQTLLQARGCSSWKGLTGSAHILDPYSPILWFARVSQVALAFTYWLNEPLLTLEQDKPILEYNSLWGPPCSPQNLTKILWAHGPGPQTQNNRYPLQMLAIKVYYRNILIAFEIWFDSLEFNPQPPPHWVELQSRGCSLFNVSSPWQSPFSTKCTEVDENENYDNVSAVKKIWQNFLCDFVKEFCLWFS